DGTRDFPEEAKVIVPDPWYGKETDQLLGDIARSFNRVMGLDRKSPFLNQSYSFAIGDQLELGQADKALGYNVSLSYNKDYEYYSDGKKYYYEILGEQIDILNPKKLTADELGDEKVIWSAMLNTSLKLNSNHKLGVRFMHNQSGQSSARKNEGSEPDENRFVEERTLGYLERGMTTFQVNGKHIFHGASVLNAEWFSSYTLSTQDEPDFRQFFNDTDPLYIRANKEPRRDGREMQETNWDSKIHFTLPFRAFNRSAKFKFGGSYATKYRTSEVNHFSLIRQGRVDYTGDPASYLAPENFIDSTNNWNVLYYYNTLLSNEVRSYRANQHVLGTYAMVDIPLFEKLRMVLGVRYELSNQFVENYVDTTEFNVAKHYESGDGSYKDLLPSINLTCELAENMNLRFA
ncbi:TonB-dependent receptor, partial [bacterium]|nr:TonB-dependent receptor [bacterium]